MFSILITHFQFVKLLFFGNQFYNLMLKQGYSNYVIEVSLTYVAQEKKS